MSARLFRRIKSSLSRFNKTYFFAVAVLALVVFFPAKLFAAEPDPTTRSRYPVYLDLFDAAGSGVSPATGGNLIKDAATNAVVGLKVNINLGFNSTDQDKIEGLWEYVDDGSLTDSADSRESFIVRVCDTATNCWLNNVPFANIDENNARGNLLTKTKSGTYKNPTQVLNLSILKSDADGVQWKYARAAGKNEGVVSSFNGISLSKGSSVEVTLWYCANNVDNGGDAENSYTSPGNDNMATFGNLCGGDTYFRVGAPLNISIPTDNAAIDAQVNTQQATGTGTPGESVLPECGFNTWGLSGTINGCIARVAYGIYVLVAWIAGILGNLFDFFLGYSVSDSSYRYDFAVSGWKLVRDISNIFFIIIMVWTGFSAVFDTSKTGSMRKVVPQLIINAILINFSLFATRVVIDISNVTARMFYSQMVVCDKANISPDGKCDPAQAKRGAGGYWPLSEKIVSSFNPQQLFKNSTLQPPTSFAPESNTADFGANTVARTVGTTEADYANYFMVVCLVAAIIMGFVGIMFFKVSFLFIGRVIGLYICMIFSPFAFLSWNMPMLNKVKQLKWDDWTSELTNYAMLAPVFVFFLYIIYTFLSSDFAQEIGYRDTSGSFMGTALGVIIPMLIIYFMLDYARKAAEGFSGSIGKSVQSLGNTVTGLAVGAATGGAALLGGRVVGGLAKRLDESGTGAGIRNLAAKSGVAGFAGRTLQRGLNAGRSGSFDVRQTAVGQGLFKQLGINTNQAPLNALSGFGLGLGTDQRKGGLEADIKRRQEKQEAKAQLLEEKMTDDQIKAYNERRGARRENEITNIVDKEIARKNNLSLKDVREWKKTNQSTYEAEKTAVQATAPVQTAIAAVAPAPAPLKSAAELSTARREEFAKNLEKGGWATQLLTNISNQGEGGAQIADLLGATIGAAIGTEVRGAGSKKAAKKIKDKNKITKDLETINETLKKGFQDMIGLEMFQSSPKFKALSAAEQADIVRDGKIQSGTKKGQGMYDILDPSEQAAINAEHTRLNTKLNDKNQEDARKEQLRQYEELVKVREQSKYNIKDINRELSDAKKDWVANPGDAAMKKAFLDKLKEKEKAETHLKTWQNINKHMEDQRNKLKDDAK